MRFNVATTIGLAGAQMAATLDGVSVRNNEPIAVRAGQTLVGFAAETGEGALAYGREKLERKGLDAVVVNDVGRADIGFEGDHNEVTIVTAGDEHHVPRTTKAEVAAAVLDEVERLRAGAPPRVAS